MNSTVIKNRLLDRLSEASKEKSCSDHWIDRGTVSQSVSLSVCLSVCLSICQSVSQTVSLSVCRCVCMCLSVCLSVSLPDQANRYQLINRLLKKQILAALRLNYTCYRIHHLKILKLTYRHAYLQKVIEKKIRETEGNSQDRWRKKKNACRLFSEITLES